MQNILMHKGLDALEIGLLFIPIDDSAEYIGAEGASLPGSRRISYFHR
jgi:hypothetical protein